MLYLLKRTIVYIIGFFVLSTGVAFSAHCMLGVSPVGSVPVAINEGFKVHNLGMCSSFVMFAYIILSIAILGVKKYKWINLLQIFPATIFGFFVFTAENILLFFYPEDPSTYTIKILYLIISILCISFGVYFYLKAKYLNLPADSVFVAIHQRWNIKISKSKIIFDCSAVVLALAILFFTNSSYTQIGVGTLLSAILVGIGIGFCKKYLDNRVDQFLAKKDIAIKH